MKTLNEGILHGFPVQVKLKGSHAIIPSTPFTVITRSSLPADDGLLEFIIEGGLGVNVQIWALSIV